MNRVSSEAFTYHKPTKTMVCEISDLGKSFRFSPVYPDACDVGFIMESHRTKKEVVFSVSEEVIVDGDILSWELKPTPESLRKAPEVTGLRVTIFND